MSVISKLLNHIKPDPLYQYNSRDLVNDVVDINKQLLDECVLIDYEFLMERLFDKNNFHFSFYRSKKINIDNVLTALYVNNINRDMLKILSLPMGKYYFPDEDLYVTKLNIRYCYDTSIADRLSMVNELYSKQVEFAVYRKLSSISHLDLPIFMYNKDTSKELFPHEYSNENTAYIGISDFKSLYPEEIPFLVSNEKDNNFKFIF